MDQANRPRTRGLEASEAEEDARIIKAALKDPPKLVRKTSQKLRNDKNDELDEEDKIFYQQPPYDDDESEGRPVMRRRRGGGRRGYVRKRMKLEGGEEEVVRRHVPPRLSAALKEEIKPKIVPWESSSIEYQQVKYAIGDIVSTTSEEDDTTYYAQILGFHTDQFCERYVSIRWLIPRREVDLEGEQRQEIKLDLFITGVPQDQVVNLNSFRFESRPAINTFQSTGPISQDWDTMKKYYLYNNQIQMLDSPSLTLTSAEKRY